MQTKAKIALAVGGGVLALGAAVGVGALAANLGGTEPATAQTGYGQGGRDGGGAPGDRGGMDTTQLAKNLAAKLGVDETRMATALKEVMTASRPTGQPSGQPSGQPTAQAGGAGNGGSGIMETMAKSLAQKLDLDEATVLAALTESMGTGRNGAGGGSDQPSSQPTG